jgi:putative ABC transport system substrate-binding protein
MNRRAFITLLAGAAGWPLAARAQQAGERVRRIGLLMGTVDDREGQARVTALKQGLQELGWTDGRNIQIEIRFGGADVARIRAPAELVALAPDAIVGQTTPVIRALRQATSFIPIVAAARVHIADRRRGSGVAAQGSRAAASDAGDRMAQRRIA